MHIGIKASHVVYNIIIMIFFSSAYVARYGRQHTVCGRVVWVVEKLHELRNFT